MSASQMIYLGIIVVIVIIMILAVVLFVSMSKKEKKGKNSKNSSDTTSEKTTNISNKKTVDLDQVKKDSIFKFMDFDDIKDNMIIRKNGNQFVMVIQCKGINFDLMSEGEKIAVEEGFLQFLNTLRYPVQLYVQTRSLDLSEGIKEYKDRISIIENNILKLQQKIREAEKKGDYNTVEKLRYQERSQRNVLEYGIDIVGYIARMSQNKNVLQQKTYVVINYYKTELGDLDLKANDINDLVFSELYTRVQTIINALLSAGVESEVLNSEELAELLYVAYNRDDSELLDFEQALDMQYDALYSTSADVIKKKEAEIEERIENEAIDLASQAVLITNLKENVNAAKESEKEKVLTKALETLAQYENEFEPYTYRKTVYELLKITDNKYSGKKLSDLNEEINDEEVEEKTKKKATKKNTTSSRSKKAKVTEE